MRSVFAIAPLALVLAWLGPQPGSGARAFSGQSLPRVQAMAPADAQAQIQPLQVLAPLGFRSGSTHARDAALREAAARSNPPGVSSLSLMEAAVVR